MASYNLNEVLKRKAAQKNTNTQQDMRLDDLSRVKVLSPGRQVFKRFIRNRLAVFGTILLIVMFVFSFLGPLFYAYGQKQTFYKYNTQNINYALCRESTAYNGYVLDASISLSRNAKSMVNTYAAELKKSGNRTLAFLDEDGTACQVDMLEENILTLSKSEASPVCSMGGGEVTLGVVDTVKKSLTWNQNAQPIEGLETIALKSCKGASGSFDFDGTTYTYQEAKGKSYTLSAKVEGFVYTGDALDAAFETAANEAVEGIPFAYGEQLYLRVGGKDADVVYALRGLKPAMVYTRYIVDLYSNTESISEEFRVQSLLAACESGTFTADGKDYTIAPSADGFVIMDSEGREYADLSTFIIRRYNGEDTMAYDLKEALRSTIEEMQDSKILQASLTWALPRQNEVGEYDYAEDGSLNYDDTLMKITQKDTGEFVVNCNQIIYVIDRFAAPSTAHILGTDGDGFDVFARIMYGGRVSLLVGFVVVFLETFLGVIMGGLAGYYGGWVDNIIMRLVDIFYCLPSMPIMIILGAMMDALRMDTYIRLMIMMASLGIMGWSGVARLVRGQILSLREQEFMIATEATGIKVRSRIFRHLVPNVMPQLIVSATMGVGGTILTESTLSFLGLGVKHPLATWGTIINSVSSASAMAHYAFIWIPVGLLICLTVIAFNFVGDGLRDAYDPKSKR